MFIKFFLIMMIVFAVLAVQTSKLRRAVIYLGVFSLISSFCYLLYQAPDVAIAEAIIGSTLATILYLVALQKYSVFTIYFTDEAATSVDDGYISRARNQILDNIEHFCTSKELEPQVIYTQDTLDSIKKGGRYDLIVRRAGNEVFIYGHEQNYHLGSLVKYINDRRLKRIKFVMFRDEERA